MPKQCTVSLIALLAGLILNLPALAAPVGTTPDTRPVGPDERRNWKEQGVSVQFGGTYLAGNADLLTLNTSAEFNRNWGPHQLFLDAANAFTMTGGTAIVNRANGTVMYAYALRENLNLFAYSTHAFDSSTKLNYRLTSAAGLCLHRIGLPTTSLGLVSLGLAMEDEWYQQDITRNMPRTVLRTSFTLPVTSNLDLGIDGFYTQALTDWSNYRVYGEAFAKVKVLPDLLSLKLSAADEYASLPVAGVKPNDFGAFTTLSFEWGQ